MANLVTSDIEQECEDAVFEVCDARERYPTKCTNQLAQCIRLENEICLAPIEARAPPAIDPPRISEQQLNFLEKLGIGTKDDVAWMERRNKKMARLLDKMEDLKVVAEQIEREKHNHINRALRE